MSKEKEKEKREFDTDCRFFCKEKNNRTKREFNLTCPQYLGTVSVRIEQISAIKEFAERLKGKAMTKFDWSDAVDVEEIDNLVKEMTEGKDNEFCGNGSQRH